MAAQSVILLVILLVLIPVYVIYKPPRLVISYFQRRFPEVLFQVRTSQRVVALTIDDAPTQYTSAILDILKSNDASATFFVIGDHVADRPELLTDILQAGSELGNHAMHDEPSVSLSSATLASQIVIVDKLIDNAHEVAGIGRKAHYFRPGSGIFSRRILDVVSSTKYRAILGSIYPHDPFIKYWWLNAWHILSMLRPGAVIICHDRRSWTIPMLKYIIPEMKRRGYQVVSVSKLLELTNN
jgi:peptidoglycan/xylan/chitin deacetylase (PgdA/CDA1 family)